MTPINEKEYKFLILPGPTLRQMIMQKQGSWAGLLTISPWLLAGFGWGSHALGHCPTWDMATEPTYTSEGLGTCHKTPHSRTGGRGALLALDTPRSTSILIFFPEEKNRGLSSFGKLWGRGRHMV